MGEIGAAAVPPGDEEGDLLDAYMDAALGGSPPDPEAFLAGRPAPSAALRSRLGEIHRLSSTPRRPPPPGPLPEVEAGLPWERLGDFRLLRTLAAGGMGVVYEAVQEPLGRRVALKVLRKELRSSPEARERFRREAQAVARLRHPGIVSVFASGETGGACWLAMDLIEGRGLDAVLVEASGRGEAIPPARAARWGEGIARALAYAHGRGVVHRDVKPSNVWITAGGEPMLLDFGVAREEGTGASTLTTAFVGSVPYAAPEQLAGRRVDGRADVYGLGVTLYQCLAGALPFDGDSVDRVIHRVLHEEPAPPRRLRPGIPRDLEVVILKALEKEPGERYATAAALAADLEAVLEFRPVAARPPGPLRRLRAFARARPAVATALAAVVLGAAGLLWMGAEREVAERRRVREEAAGEVAQARGLLEDYRVRRDAAMGLEEEMAGLRELLETKYLPRERQEALDRGEERLEGLRRERESVFHRVLDHLGRAERLHPGVEGTDAVRALVYVERWRDAAAARDRGAAEFYGGLVAEHDPTGELARQVAGEGTLALATDPPGAEVHLFRFREQAEVVEGGERRLVPVPRGGEAPVPPGAFVLRVVGGAGELVPGDLVTEVAGRPVRDLVLVTEGAGPVGPLDRLLSVDGEPVRDAWDLDEIRRTAASGEAPPEREFLFETGEGTAVLRGRDLDSLGVRCAVPRTVAEAGGVPARAWTGGALRDLLLPPGLSVRASAASPVLGPASLAGATPLKGLRLPSGSWLAVLRRPGCEEVRVPFVMAPGESLSFDVPLLPPGSTPPGFVRVPCGADRPFSIGEHEVTCADYLEFLNDPATLARLGAGEGSPLAPRSGQTGPGGHFARDREGRFLRRADWAPDWPVLGVSFEDARAYAAWRTERERPLRGRGEYRLPTMEEWAVAAFAYDRRFPFGQRFRPGWVKSCFARPRAAPEPVLRFPRDESAMGVFDLAGGAAEWLDDWFDRPRGLRRVASGSWAWPQEELFAIWGGMGWYPTHTGDEAGFRVVLVERGK